MATEKEVSFTILEQVGEDTTYYLASKRMRMLDGKQYTMFMVARNTMTGYMAVFPAVLDAISCAPHPVSLVAVAGDTEWDRDHEGLLQELCESVGQTFGGILG